MKPQIETLDINSLIPYARNARTHSEAQIAQIAGSIKEFGFTNPILIDKDNGIIAGHGRVAAARKLNLSQVPCIRLEHLSETQRKAYILADNRIALNSGWETELLSTELEELKDLGINLESLGFDSDEIDALLNKIEPTVGLTDEDEAPEVQEQAITKLGDIWVMGNHRLMCGDSTSIDAQITNSTWIRKRCKVSSNRSKSNAILLSIKRRPIRTTQCTAIRCAGCWQVECMRATCARSSSVKPTCFA